MAIWPSTGKKPEKAPLANAAIRVGLLTQDSALLELLQKQLRGGFIVIGDPPGQGGFGPDTAPALCHGCDAILIDLRIEGLSGAPRAGLALMDEIRKAPSHPPMVALCDAADSELPREVMRHGAHDKMFAPLKINELQVILRRAFEFHSAEMKLQQFLSTRQARSAQPQQFPRRTQPRTQVSSRTIARSRQTLRPSGRIVVAALTCLTLLAGIVAIRTILAGTLAANPAAFETQSAIAGQNATSAKNLATPRPLDFKTAPAARPFLFEKGFRGSSPEDGPTPVVSVQPRSEAHDLRGTSAQLNSATPPSRLQLLEHTPRFQPALLIEHLAPRYSQLARQQHLQGTVQVRALISKTSVPHTLSLVSGDPVLAQMAFDAISLWRYQPALLDGQPVESEVLITIDFKLPD